MKRRLLTWRELIERLARADSAEERARIINSMTFKDMANVDAEFEAWAHKNQLPPDGLGWDTWLMMAGRGFGKTRAGAAENGVKHDLIKVDEQDAAA